MASRFPPGPTRAMGLRYYRHLTRDGASFALYLARRYGDAVHWTVGKQHIYQFNHPDAVREVLVEHPRSFKKSRALKQAKSLLGEGLLTSEGEFHLRQRRLLQPAFHRQRIAAMGDVMAESADRLGAGWRDGETRDVADDMMALALTIVGRTLFGADVGRDINTVGEALEEVLSWSLSPLTRFLPRLERAGFPAAVRVRAARERLDAVVRRLIEDRRASGDSGDMVSMLLAAQEPDDGAGGMSDRQVRDEALTIFLAGHETTANALTWTWYLLSQHRDVEARLHAELDRVLAGRRPTAADAPDLPYTRQVLSEALRLYPPAWTMAREATEPVEILGYPIPAGAMVLIPQYAIHRDPRFFPRPERFEPDRWTPAAQAGRHRYAYFPFGAGSRICIGEAFAWLEATLVIATLAQRWRLRHDPAARVALRPLITLRPRYGMVMRLERRRAHPAVAPPESGPLPTTAAD